MEGGLGDDQGRNNNGPIRVLFVVINLVNDMDGRNTKISGSFLLLLLESQSTKQQQFKITS